MADYKSAFKNFNPDVFNEEVEEIRLQNAAIINDFIEGVQAANRAFEEIGLDPVFRIHRNSNHDFTKQESGVYIRIADNALEQSRQRESNAVGAALECYDDRVVVAGLRATFSSGDYARYTTRDHHEDIEIFGHRMDGNSHLWRQEFERIDLRLEQKAVTQAIEHLRFWLCTDYPDHAVVFDAMLGLEPDAPEQGLDHDHDDQSLDI